MKARKLVVRIRDVAARLEANTFLTEVYNCTTAHAAGSTDILVLLFV